MILGIIFGALLGAFAAFLAWAAVDSCCYRQKHELAIKIFAMWLSATLVILLGGTIGKTVENVEFRSQVEVYKVTRELYSASFEDDRLGGFERVELVKMANEASTEMAKAKVQIEQWWSVGVDADIKAEIRALRPIK